MTVTSESVTALVNLLVALQGAILGVYFATRRHIPAIASVNVVLLLCSLSVFPLNAFSLLSGIASGDTFLQHLSNGMLAMIGPTLYLHAKHRSIRTVHRSDLYHYVPAFTVLILAQVALDPRLQIVLLAAVFSGLGVYLFVTARVLRRGAGSGSPWLVAAIISTAMIVVANGIIETVITVSDVVELNTTLLFALPIFALLFDELGAGRTSDALRARPASGRPAPGQAHEVAETIKRYLEEGAYKRQNLSVRDIASDIGVPIKLVSSVVNSELGKSVPELITSYRIEEAKRQLSDPENERYTILALASASGFGSGPRFNTVFREYEGMTPSEYKRRFKESTS